MKRASVIAWVAMMLMGCCEDKLQDKLQHELNRPQFAVAIANKTTQELNNVTCMYPGGQGLGGIMSAGVNSVADADLPKGGPIIVSWVEAGGSFRAEVPLLARYVVRPQGILVIRICANHTVNVQGIRTIEYLRPELVGDGDAYAAARTK